MWQAALELFSWGMKLFQTQCGRCHFLVVWYFRVLHFKSFLQRVTPCVMDYYGLLRFYTSCLIFRIFFKVPSICFFLITLSRITWSRYVFLPHSDYLFPPWRAAPVSNWLPCQPSPHNAVCLPVCDSTIHPSISVHCLIPTRVAGVILLASSHVVAIRNFFLILLPLLFAFPFIILFNWEIYNSNSLNSLPAFLSASRLDHQSGAWQKVNDYYCRVILFLMKPYTECGAGRHHYSCFDVQIGNDTFSRRDARRDHRKETGGLWGGCRRRKGGWKKKRGNFESCTPAIQSRPCNQRELKSN